MIVNLARAISARVRVGRRRRLEAKPSRPPSPPVLSDNAFIRLPTSVSPKILEPVGGKLGCIGSCGEYSCDQDNAEVTGYRPLGSQAYRPGLADALSHCRPGPSNGDEIWGPSSGGGLRRLHLQRSQIQSMNARTKADTMADIATRATSDHNDSRLRHEFSRISASSFTGGSQGETTPPGGFTPGRTLRSSRHSCIRADRRESARPLPPHRPNENRLGAASPCTRSKPVGGYDDSVPLNQTSRATPAERAGLTSSPLEIQYGNI